MTRAQNTAPKAARRADWTIRLRDAVEAARTRPFNWADHNCGFFVADCVLAMTGWDPGAFYRGRYRSRRTAYATLRKNVGGGVRELGLAVFGEPLPSPALAGRGDVVMVGHGPDEALGIVVGAHIAVTSPEGLGFLPLSAARLGWRI